MFFYIISEMGLLNSRCFVFGSCWVLYFFALLKANEVESATWDWTNQGESKNSQL